jgi:uncharacterized protein (DUF983 family)
MIPVGFVVSAATIVELVQLNTPLWLNVILVARGLGVLQRFLLNDLNHARLTGKRR